jgi:hypothetical protein
MIIKDPMAKMKAEVAKTDWVRKFKIEFSREITQSSNPLISQSFDELTQDNEALTLSYTIIAMHCSMLQLV